MLRAIGFETDEQILALFPEDNESDEHHYIATTIEKEPAIKTRADALLDIYKKLGPAIRPTLKTPRNLSLTLFFSPQHYDLGLGRQV